MLNWKPRKKNTLGSRQCSLLPDERQVKIMEEMKRTFGLLPIIGSSHVYQVGKVKFHVASHFKGKTTIEERLADLMVEALYEESSENNGETEK